MEKILDKDLINLEPQIAKKLFQNIRWWENNRTLFNIVMLCCAGLPAVFGFDQIFTIGISSVLFSYFFFFVLANICFCIGWGIDVLAYYYFQNQDFGKYKVQLCFWGIFFSGFMSLIYSYDVIFFHI
ncbi:MAG: hypothetical protein AAF573_06515 [Bacteroidota bacterium]